MRHRKTIKKFNRPKNQTKAMMENLAVSVILYEKVQTTEAKAKAVRSLVEKLITKGKVKNIASKQRLSRVLPDKKAVQKVLDVLGPRYKERKGGYTRVIKIGPRLGDGAKIAQIELVE